MTINHYAIGVTREGPSPRGKVSLDEYNVAAGVYLFGGKRSETTFREGVTRNGRNGPHSRVRIKDDVAIIRPDYLGTRTILVYEADGLAICATSVALMMEAMNAFGHDVRIDPIPLATTFALGNLQLAETPLRGVTLLPIGHRVRLVSGRVAIEAMDDGGAALMTEEALRDRVVEEITENVSAFADRSDGPLLHEMTGGLDSRVTLAAMMHCGLRDRISFATRGAPTHPDRLVAERIAHAFDIEMVRRPYFEETLDTETFIERARHQAGLRWLDDVAFRMKTPRKGFVTFSGNYGEIWRSYYAELLIDKCGFGRADFAAPPSEGQVAKLFDTIAGSRKRYLRDRAGTFDAFFEYFTSFAGTMGEALFDLYIAQRNRFHYGGAAIARDGMYPTCDPLYSVSAYHYAKRLDPFDRGTGHFSFELIDRMFPALNAFPLAEKRVPASFATSPAGRRSIVATEPMTGLIERAPLKVGTAFAGQMGAHSDPAPNVIADGLRQGLGEGFLDVEDLSDRYARASAGERRALDRALISPAILHELHCRITKQRQA